MDRSRKVKKLVEFLKQSAPSTQAEAAEFLGIGATYLSDLINGGKPVTEPFAEGLVERISLNPTYFYEDDVPMFSVNATQTEELYRTFINSKKMEQSVKEGKSSKQSDNQSKYIALLEDWKDMTQVMQSEKEDKAMILAYVKTIFHYQAELRSFLEQRSKSEVAEEMNKTLIENYRRNVEKHKSLV